MAAIGLPSLSPYYAEHTDTFTQHLDTPLLKQLPSPLALFWEDVYKVSFAKDGFLEGKIVPYLDVEGEGKKNGGRWYVLPGTRVGEGDKKAREVSHLWKYMVPYSAEEDGVKKVDEGVAVNGVNGWKNAVQK
ncbi:hypothetical protein KVT40_002055 [Elsinoe batatas]|uniref:Uncharacterized protein n=1 Tax=Elsinoe batatas TaxID=2601811 RepID=A0A8K0PHU8_9PEZI|nr:hypothetical protein KVT40_002055 [Elsinoe batatas]